jgi:hypothetical protein
MKRSSRALVVSATVATLASCREDGRDCGEPLYAGNATDEAWRAIVDGEDDLSFDDADGPTITLPAEGQILPRTDEPPELAWTSPIASAPRRRTRHFARRTPAPEFSDLLARAFWGTALAHQPPITDDIYHLRIDVPGRDCPIAVLTTELSWRVDSASWETMRDATGTLSIEITSAYLTENRITEGPYRPSARRAFSIEP